MIRNYKLKAITVFLLVQFTVSTFGPGVSYALTAGPTAPEATSFEPVDTTDIVNMVTGDLAYNIPLVEVPGPAGGYPLSLSYHAGIMPNVDASWVGLGFALNPGAINRSVSGYADDFSSVYASDRSFWQGGSTTTYTIGVNVGYGGFSGVSAGLTFSEDTYRGFGVGYDISGKFGINSANGSLSYGKNPYGGTYSATAISGGIGIGKSFNGLSVSAGWGFSAQSINGGAASISSGFNVNASVLGQSISSSSRGSGFSIGSLFQKSVYNSNAGNISTSGYNYMLNIPTPWGFGIRLGKSYQRYWTDETALVATNGALHFPQTVPTNSSLDLVAYDVYDLMDVTKPIHESIPQQSQAGSFIDYDNFQVVAQGLSGSIRPYHYKSYLLRQNQKNGDKDIVKSYPLQGNAKPTFRFEDDFSNRYIHDKTNDEFEVLSRTSPSDPALSFEFDNNRITGESGTDGFVEEKNLLPGSRAIEWFSNNEILDGTDVDESGNSIPPSANAAKFRGFLDCHAAGFTRTWDDKIGGFKITNESGVTYHYSLPVYSSEEYTYSGRKDDYGIDQFNQSKRSEPYAYTWLLTAVTGLDFVDRNENGYADQGDWGYWVSFEYGKWADSYGWRNPGIGFNKDIDQTFNNFSKGKKELYYLNAIRTETHTALFVKKLRADGKGSVEQMVGVVDVDNDHNLRAIDGGGFSEKEKTYGSQSYTEYPTSTLGLQMILLIQNKDFQSADISNLSSQSDVYYHPTNNIIQYGRKTRGKDVIDIYDIQNSQTGAQILAKCLRKIEFVTDYSLCPGTSNSFLTDLDVLNTGQQADLSYQGKLTLKSLRFYGKGGEVSLLPETKFNYGDDEAFYASMKSDAEDGSFTYLLNVTDFDGISFSKGDIIKLTPSATSFRVSYGFVYDIIPGSKQIKVKFFYGINYLSESTGILKFDITKNPPYMSDQTDLWGFYKVDQVDNPNARAAYNEDNYLSENEKRMVTSVSARELDVWSLKEVTTSLGGKIRIEYEPDEYQNALSSLSNAAIKDVERTENGKTRIVLYEDLEDYHLQVGDEVNLRFMNAIRYDVKDPEQRPEMRFVCDGHDKTHTYQWIVDENYATTNTAQIQSIDGNAFIIDYDYYDRFPYNNTNCLSKSTYKEISSSEGNTQNNTCIPFIWLDKSAPIFLGGEVLSDKPIRKFGGGLRVSKITVEQLTRNSSTLYTYTNGVTSYEPLGFAVPIRTLSEDLTYGCLETIKQDAVDIYRDKFLNDVYSRFLYLFANARELPGPGVLYEVAGVTSQLEYPSQIVKNIGRTEYQFEVFSPQTVDVENVGHSALIQSYNEQAYVDSTPEFSDGDYDENVLGLDVDEVEVFNSTRIQDYSAIMGSLKRITYFDDHNNKLSETKNHYLHDDFNAETFKDNLSSKFKNQGVITETFADARIVRLNSIEEEDPYFELFGIVSQKVRYPAIQTGQTNINYKTGLVTTTETEEFDFYSGQPVKTLSMDGYGGTYVTEVFPAYDKYPEMKPAGLGGRNMLTQEAGAVTYKYKINESDTREVTGIVSASAQTWSKETSVLGATTESLVWRKAASHSFVGSPGAIETPDGLYPFSSFSPFSSWNVGDLEQEGWQKNGSIELYDEYSHALEDVDLNQNYAATKMSSDQTLVYASVTNSRYNQFAYSGAEDVPINGEFGGKVVVGPGTIVQRSGSADDLTTHTGLKALQLSSGQHGFTFTTTALSDKKTFFASVWTNSLSGRIKYKLDGVVATASGTPVSTVKAGSWYLVNLTIPIGTATSLEVWCESNSGASAFDDFRVYPGDASIQSYVYNEWGELSYILDNNNIYTHYEYDGMGRLVNTYRETLSRAAQSNGGTEFPGGQVQTSKTIYHYFLQPN